MNDKIENLSSQKKRTIRIYLDKDKNKFIIRYIDKKRYNF